MSVSRERPIGPRGSTISRTFACTYRGCGNSERPMNVPAASPLAQAGRSRQSLPGVHGVFTPRFPNLPEAPGAVRVVPAGRPQCAWRERAGQRAGMRAGPGGSARPKPAPCGRSMSRTRGVCRGLSARSLGGGLIQTGQRMRAGGAAGRCTGSCRRLECIGGAGGRCGVVDLRLQPKPAGRRERRFLARGGCGTFRLPELAAAVVERVREVQRTWLNGAR